MQETYDPSAIEPKWQRSWAEHDLFALRGTGEKRYVLEMFPYPSGNMHMGHMRNYLIGDVLARYYRMRGFDVLHPMGWDALGLPAENAAIRDGRHPAERTAENIATFRADMVSIGYSYDWSRELSTSDPAYYKWNQWFFLRLREKGLVYRRSSRVNWCPGCATVIANEQVKADGTCERSGDVVVARRMPEWAFRITRYSEELLADLDRLTAWPDRITSAQRFWIGRSEGARIVFRVVDSDDSLEVFTTRADTLFGATALVVAPDHPLMPRLVTDATRAAVAAFAAEQEKRTARADDTEKTGVFTGARVRHPFTGRALPVWTANFVVSDYGTGALMSVPAHDVRDHEFATKYGLPVHRVIAGSAESIGSDAMPFCDDGTLIESAQFTGLASAEARTAIAAALAASGQGGPAVTYRQRDWGFSRQRYWGTPIPIVYCDACDPAHEGIAVPDDQLPVTLPPIDVAKVLTGRGEPPLAKVPAFVATTCPRCGGPARRETETMDTFVDSAWYFARYLSPNDATQPFDRAIAQRMLPVDVYVGGPEHAVMHLLYFRFWTKAMRDMGLVTIDEPVVRLVTQGIVNGADGRKMGKRWGNGVAPCEIVGQYGADAARTFVMFAGPPEKDIDWSDAGVEGGRRFLARLWRVAWTHRDVAREQPQGGETGQALAIRQAAHRTLKRVTDDLERLSFNTAIARLMELLNVLAPLPVATEPAERAAIAEAIRLFAAMLSPIAPHIADEIGEEYKTGRDWPAWDPALVREETITYTVQVNGRMRGQVEVTAEAEESEVTAAAQQHVHVAAYLAGHTVQRVVFVPKRLVNFVVR